MKVIHVSGAKSWRGGEQQIAYLLDELSEQSSLFCPEKAPLVEYARRREIPVRTYRRRWAAGRSLTQYAHSQKADLIHLHDAHAHQIGVLSATFAQNRALMVLSRRVFFRPSPNPISRWRYNHSAIRRILCVSEAVRELHRSYVRRPERLVVVPSGIDPDKFPKQPTGKLRHVLQLTPEVPLIGTVGALTAEKDHRRFLEVALAYRQQNKTAHFVLIGEGRERQSLEQFVREHQLEDRVHLLGFRDDIPDLLPDLDVFLFTSRHEGLGTSVLDAFAAGVPVVATDAGGIPEMVRHGETGRLSAVGDTEQLFREVQHLLTYPEHAQRLVTQAGAYLQQRFTKTAMAEATYQVYRELLG